MTQATKDTLLAVNKQKTKVIHVNGGWCRVCWQMLPFVDYLDQHKKDNVEITVILTTQFKSKKAHHYLLNWLRERGITINYYEMQAKESQNAGLFDSVPTTYVVLPNGSSFRFVGSTDQHKNNLLYLLKKDVLKTIEAVDAFYEKRKNDLRETVLFEGKKYVLHYFTDWKLEGNKGEYRTEIQANEGDLFKITTKGRIRLGAAAGYATPEGISNDLFKMYNIVEAANHGKLMAFFYDSNWKVVQGMLIGKGGTFTVTTSGRLVLKINDKDYQNNQGYFEGEIKRFRLVKD